VIDWDRLKELREEVGPEDFDEVVDLFLDEVEGVMDRLRESPDLATLEEDLHFLKGSALSLGFRQFSALCQAGETNALLGNASQIDLPEILSCYDRSKAKFIADLPGQLAA
jgi:HPt (histidine-containing phosphotransfer) domain-containing protein